MTKKRIGLVSCTKQKRDYTCAAHDLYAVSPLFNYASDYCKRHYDEWYILSAKHGLVEINEQIEPYDETLNGAKKAQKLAWSKKVMEQLIAKIDDQCEVFIHAGNNYSEHLTPLLDGHGISWKKPLEGKAIGQQLGWYKNEREGI